MGYLASQARKPARNGLTAGENCFVISWPSSNLPPVAVQLPLCSEIRAGKSGEALKISIVKLIMNTLTHSGCFANHPRANPHTLVASGCAFNPDPAFNWAGEN
jgi:hypothetical protein